MVATEIFLIAAGVICVVVSVVMSFGDDKENVESSAKSELTQAQLDMVKHQVDEVIKQQISGLSEKTEAALDKISNTKILEMNEYAESVLGEINRNHNEAVFLYDMLNEKSKEVKTTVKDVNYAKKQVEQISGRTSDMSDNAVMSEEHEQDRTDDGKEPAYEQAVKSGKDTKDIAKERLAALVKKSNQKAKNAEDRINTQADSLNKEYSNNERILQMNASGVSVKEIAKKLNMGVGEVRLVINLYKGVNNNEVQILYKRFWSWSYSCSCCSFNCRYDRKE